jgi:hypothetical protein
VLGEFIRAVLERALESELTAHLGYEKHESGHWDDPAVYVGWTASRPPRHSADCGQKLAGMTGYRSSMS